MAQRLLDVLKDHDPTGDLDVHALMNSLRSAGSEEGDGDEAQQGPDD